MFRVLLVYQDINTQSLLKDKFEQEGFEVFIHSDLNIMLEQSFDILICEDDLEIKPKLDIPIVKIAKYYTNIKDSSLLAYVNKPFRPTEVILKARLLARSKFGINTNNVRKTA